MSFKPGVCNLCGTGCGHLLKTDGNHIYGVSPSLNHPVSKGKLCVRGWHINELMSTDERINTPLVRKDGVLRPVSQDEAVGVILDRVSSILKSGRELGVIASARSSNEDNYLLKKLSGEVFKSGNINISAEAGHAHTVKVLSSAFGVAGTIGKVTDIDTAGYIFVVGSDITKMNPVIGSNIHRAALRGARVVTLSSYRTQIAKLSNVHLRQKLGTKKVALIACAKALLDIRRGQGSLETGIDGFAELARVLDSISQEALSSACGIAYDEIKAEMQFLANASSVVILFSSGISGLDRETLNSIANLALLTGKIGHEGSALIPVTGICNLQGSFDMGLGGGNVFDLLAEKNPKLGGLFVVDHDDGIIRDKDSIASLDLVVYVGAFKNKFMDLAHVVLPIAAFTEYDGTYTSGERRVQLSQVKTVSLPNIVPAWRLYTQIASKAGLSWQYDGSASVFDEVARSVPGYQGMTHAELAKGFGRQWTVSHDSPYRFQQVNSEIPTDVTNSDFPYMLMVGKAQHFWHQNNLMRKTFIPKREYDATLLLYPEGYIEISPDDAKKLQVRDKWMVKVSSRVGAMKIAVKISEDVQNGTSYVPYFINDMITGFLVKHDASMSYGEEFVTAIRIEKV